MSPKEQLDSFIDRFSPDVAKKTRRALAKIRRLTRGAIEIVYDNYNALAIGFSPTERASDAIVSIAVYPKYPTLFFLQGGPKLPDPTKRLKGGGTRVRHVRLEDVDVIDEPDVRALIDVALARAKVPLDPRQKRRLVIKSIAEKQRPRR